MPLTSRSSQDVSADSLFNALSPVFLVAGLIGTLTLDISTALSALSERKFDVAALDIQSLVLDRIQTLQSKTDVLGANLVTISSVDLQAKLQALVDGLDTAFASAILVYSCSNETALPLWSGGTDELYSV